MPKFIKPTNYVTPRSHIPVFVKEVPFTAGPSGHGKQRAVRRPEKLITREAASAAPARKSRSRRMKKGYTMIA